MPDEPRRIEGRLAVWSELARYEVGKLRQRIIMWIAWHLPRVLVYWCYMRVAAHATTGEYEADTNANKLLMMDAIDRWEKPALRA